MKQRLLNILFWSILAAAFIGPGTVTTSAAAGADFGYALLWALTFSIIACIVLQEASARLTLASGFNLGESIRIYFAERRFGWTVTVGIIGSIILGCVAYETGNILGAVAGATLIVDAPSAAVTLSVGIAAAVLLWFGSTKIVARVLGFVVAFMGVCFLTTAIIIQPELPALLEGGLIPSFPPGSELLVLGLIGTTVVPYNIFLGSGIAHRQTISEMRFSLVIAIVLGGLISISVLIVGAALVGEFTFEALADQLALQLGGWAAHLLGLGLWGAGFSSAITAAMAAAIVARSAVEDGERAWQYDGMKYRMVWGGVLIVGVGFGVAEVQPIPAIIAAQALNGIILPVVAIYLMLMVNNARTMSPDTINSRPLNVLMGLVVFTTIVLGLTNLLRALNNLFEASIVDPQLILYLSTGLALLLAWPIVRQVRRLRAGAGEDVSLEREPGTGIEH